MTDFTYSEGDTVRFENRPAIVKRIRLDGTVDLWTDYGLRTVDSHWLTPARKGDKVTPTPAEWASRRKAGTR